MKVKFSALVSDMRGKLNGSVASYNRGGNYFRNKVTPVNPSTSFQWTVRNNFGANSVAWKSLTEAQRKSFNANVASFQKTNVFGDLKTPSGIALFQRLNANLRLVGATTVTTCPTPAGVSVTTLSSGSGAAGTPALSIVNSGTVPSGTRMRVFATPQQPAGVSYVKNKLRFVVYKTGGSAATTNLLSDWQTRYGETLEAGNAVWVYVDFVNQNTGEVSAQQYVKIIIAA